MVIGPSVPLDVVKTVTDEHSAKLVKIKHGENKSFLDINKEIAFAVYREIMKNELGGKSELSQEDLHFALNLDLPCRMEEISDERIKKLCPSLDYYPRKTYMDAAHNEQAVKYLLKAIDILEKNDETGSSPKIYALASFSLHKDVESCLKLMAGRCEDIRMILLPHVLLYNKSEAEKLVKSVKESGGAENEKIHDIEFDGKLEDNLKATLETINKNQDEDAILLLCGSVYIMEDIRDLFEIPQFKEADNKCLDVEH